MQCSPLGTLGIHLFRLKTELSVTLANSHLCWLLCPRTVFVKVPWCVAYKGRNWASPCHVLCWGKTRLGLLSSTTFRAKLKIFTYRTVMSVTNQDSKQHTLAHEHKVLDIEKVLISSACLTNTCTLFHVRSEICIRKWRLGKQCNPFFMVRKAGC